MAYSAPPRDWLLRVWDDEAVAFDAASGDTHYLRPLTRVLFEACQADPGLDAGALAARAAQALGVALSPDFLNAVHDGLDSLHRIGLLRTP